MSAQESLRAWEAGRAERALAGESGFVVVGGGVGEGEGEVEVETEVRRAGSSVAAVVRAVGEGSSWAGKRRRRVVGGGGGGEGERAADDGDDDTDGADDGDVAAEGRLQVESADCSR